MRALLSLAQGIHRVSRGLGYLAAGATLAMVLVGAYNAIARYLGKYLGTPLTSNALVELQWYLFSIVFLFGAPYALKVGAHVRVDVLYERLGPRRQSWINLGGCLLLLLPFAALGIWASWDYAVDSIASRKAQAIPTVWPAGRSRPWSQGPLACCSCKGSPS